MSTTEQPKETVILVHGTWAAQPGTSGAWYSPDEGSLPPPSFVAKLDQALERHGSPARCWAHCANPRDLFRWTGENSWIARTRAAATLKDTLTKLINGGWTCHLIAHSHGGNIAIDAIRDMLHQSSYSRLGMIVTLGTPFMDTTSNIIARKSGVRRAFGLPIILTGWISVIAISLPFLAFWLVIPLLAYNEVGVLTAGAMFLFNASALVVFWGFIKPIMPERGSEPVLFRGKRRILVLNSFADEACHLLRLIRRLKNQFASPHGIARHTLKFAKHYFSQRTMIAELHGLASFRTASIGAKMISVLFYFSIIGLLSTIGFMETKDDSEAISKYIVITCFIVVTFISIAIILYWTHRDDTSDSTCVLAPALWIGRTLRVIAAIPNEMATYGVRKRAWPIFQQLALGLVSYQHELPSINLRPKHLRSGLYQYESLPTHVVFSATKKRDDAIIKEVGTVTRFLGRRDIAMGDMSSLLEQLEMNVSLVHAVYYADDECIERIARWIAGKG